ncbi:putative quinol monooxygenase [Rhodococcus koreensis]|uniref:putative quinol monooxygenase n=1 Tax=Rhodococcus koreensis TaxID=99653 RepID=UPI0019809CED|nr:putative quinol monooxygenase [Rhodococcus koreensis]QSE84971.1 antibiotic biosynthesis monooxygenase [Rhodococcus koreensis]
MTFTLFVTMEVRPDRVDAFVDAITENAEASLRDEPGCLVFDVHRDAEQPTRFYLYEIYADEEAFFVTHRNAPHYTRWANVAPRYLVEGGHHNTFARPLRLGNRPRSAADR